ncbi:AMP binding protein [Roridomyces roridus]|uniref:AMP binding protein n=1 Tax=Roridomyces roridus TaxID=1738132 RepID=A0AAD7BYG1_9AGAR|nr:AMP binding protein [Roridomyces roridus]
MVPRVYTSNATNVAPLIDTKKSVFTRVLPAHPSSKDIIGGFPASKPALIDEATGVVLTRSRLRELSLALAYGLQHHSSLQALARGSTALVFSPNCLAYPVIVFGCKCIAAGLRLTVANAAYLSHELAHQYTDNGASLLFTSQDGVSVVQAMFAELGVSKEEAARRTVVLDADLGWVDGKGPSVTRFSELLSLGALEEEEKFNGAAADETVFLCYSSGTTGKPKGVETTHANMVAILDILAPNWPKLPAGREIVPAFLPFYHIYSLAILLSLGLTLGWTSLVQPRFNPVQFFKAIEKYRIALACVAPPVLVVLARHPDAGKYDLSSLEYMLSAAAPLSADLVKEVQTKIASGRADGVKCKIVQLYGLTETTTATNFLSFADVDRKVGSVGPLVPHLERRIVEDEEGNVDVKDGQPGELWVRGQTVMKGYLNNPAANEESFASDGWFKTGDIVVRDREGYFWVVDRRKELIKYKGYQVAPAELESVLLTHPDVADAAVIGVNSVEEATELPRAYVVHARPAELAFEKNVARWMEGKVARHKFLRGGVRVVDVIPKSAAGKILRRELREEAKKEGVQARL